METVEHPPIPAAEAGAVPPAAPVHAHSDDLPPWLELGAAPVSAGPFSKPAVTWGATLAVTSLMVAFGLWLGDSPKAPAVTAAQPVPAVAPLRAAPVPPPLVLATPAPVPPPLVLATPAPPPLVLAAPAPEPASVAADVAAATPFSPANRVVPAARTARPLHAAAIKRAKPERRPLALAKPRAVPALRRATPAPAPVVAERSSLAVMDSPQDKRVQCKHGELVRECLARYH